MKVLPVYYLQYIRPINNTIEIKQIAGKSRTLTNRLLNTCRALSRMDGVVAK